MSLCFDEAYDDLQRARISEEEYLHHALAHFSGTRHPADETKRPWELMVKDPIGNAVREAALNSSQSRSEKDIKQLEQLFHSARRDDAEAVRVISSQLGHSNITVQAIATFSAIHGNAQVLRLCVQLGASLEEKNTSLALEFADRAPALLDVLYQYDWRDMQTSSLSFQRMFEWSLRTNPSELIWFLEHDARVDKDVVRRAVHGAPVKAPCIGVLISRFGADLFRGTGLLQNAAKRGRNDILTLLLDAGLNVDELLPPSTNHEGEGQLTALYEAVYKQHEDTVQLLLSYGADPNKRVCDGESALDTPFRLAESHDRARIVGILRRYGGKHVKPGERAWTSRL